MAAAPVSSSSASSRNISYSQGSSTGGTQSQSYIPEYSTTPILEGIAKYAQEMAPQVYAWGMDQFNKNQGDIDTMMRNALSYANPQRIAQEMGMAQAGVMQGAEAGRQNAMRDLQSFGVDPSSGRYAGLDQANRVMAGAAAAGAGNQQRMATEAAGNAMQNQALSSSLQNVNTGYNAANQANQFLNTGMSLKYPPLGTISGNDLASQQSSFSMGTSDSSSHSEPLTRIEQWGNQSGQGGAQQHLIALAEGGHIPDEISQSGGGRVDDVPANLTAGEFVIPKDIVEWKGQEFFYKLMAATRKMRATGGGEGGGKPQQQPSLGYGAA